MFRQAGEDASLGVHFAEIGTLIFFQFAPSPLAATGPEIYHITEPEVIFGDHIFAQPDLYHDLPGTFARDILQQGARTIENQGYVQYELPGTINGVNGTFQLGGYWNYITGNFYATHYFFSPI